MSQIVLVSEHQLSEITRMMGQISLRQIAKRLKMHYTSVWLVSKGRYKTNREKFFSHEFRMEVVNHYKESKSYNETGKKFNLCHGTVRLWAKELTSKKGFFNVDQYPCWITGWKHDLQVGTKRKLIA